MLDFNNMSTHPVLMFMYYNFHGIEPAIKPGMFTYIIIWFITMTQKFLVNYYLKPLLHIYVEIAWDLAMLLFGI